MMKTNLPRALAPGFSWGCADRELFNHSLEKLADPDKLPTLNIYMTLSTHEPFIVPEKEVRRPVCEAIKGFPEDPGLLARKARSFWLSGAKKQAMEQINAMLSVHPGHFFTMELLHQMNNGNL